MPGLSARPQPLLDDSSSNPFFDPSVPPAHFFQTVARLATCSSASNGSSIRYFADYSSIDIAPGPTSFSRKLYGQLSAAEGYAALKAPTPGLGGEESMGDSTSSSLFPVRLSFSTSQSDPQPSSSMRGPSSLVGESAGTTEVERLRKQLEQAEVNLHTALYGPPIGDEKPAELVALISRLNSLVPGGGLADRLRAARLDRIGHQTLIQWLGKEGLLSYEVLAQFRGSDHVVEISLTMTLCDPFRKVVEEFSQTLCVFDLPNAFTALRILRLNEIPLLNMDLTLIHHLPLLEALWLESTGIGDEGVAHLLALKGTLHTLHLTNNPGITSDCAPLLCCFSLLRVLSLDGTLMDMPGLRRLAVTFHAHGFELDISIPSDCREYLRNLEKHYLLRPSAPLITDPHAVPSLSLSALRKNLKAHGVLSLGGQAELEERLRALLERREADLVCREMFWMALEEKEESEMEGLEGASSEMG